MHEILEALAAGEIDVAEAQARLAGYRTTEAGRFDAARESRRGIPEAILAENKSESEVVALAEAAVETTGRAIVTRAGDAPRAAVRESFTDSDDVVDEDPAAGMIIVRAPDFEVEEVDATVVVVTAGTSDRQVAAEAAAIAREMGVTVERREDVGVAGIHRLFDALEMLRAADVVIVAAGREGALPTVIAGLVDSPVIGLPIGSGYGYGGDGEAALLGMLQSCSVLSVVNIDAGFVAGAQAALIGRAIGKSGDDA